MGAKGVLRNAGVESVGGQVTAAGDEHELIRRNYQMQKTGLAADRAVAVRNLEPRRSRHFKPDSTTVASTRMLDHESRRLPGKRFGVKSHAAAVNVCVLGRRGRPPR